MKVDGAFATNIVAKSFDYTVEEDDYTILVSGSTTITLPSANAWSGRILVIKRTGTSDVTHGFGI